LQLKKETQKSSATGIDFRIADPFLCGNVGVVVAACTYENDTEKRLHSQAIHVLARDLDRPEEEIRRYYEIVLCSLKERARIKDYLVILVSRNVKHMIKRNISSQTS
jgi:hypothetical protein